MNVCTQRLFSRSALAALLLGVAGMANAAETNKVITLESVPLDEHAAAAWREGRDEMLRIVKLGEEKDLLPKSAWFGRDQSDADEDINALLDEVLEKLQVSGLMETRKEYQSLEEQIAKNRETVRQLREDRLSAVTEKGTLEFYKKTRDEYTEEINARDKDIAAMEVEKEKLLDTFAKEYDHMGLKLSKDQIRFYLSSVTGQDVMAISSIFHNVRELNGQLQELVRQNPDDPEAARRYYGIHVVMVHAMERAYETTLKNIDNGYLERIDEIEQKNAELREETKALMKQTPELQRGVLESSLRTQQVTADTLVLYREHLTNVRERIEKGLEAVRLRHAVAKNAYDTIHISSVLASEMQTALKDLNTLRDMHLPDLVPIADAVIQQKFNEITSALQAHE